MIIAAHVKHGLSSVSLTLFNRSPIGIECFFSHAPFFCSIFILSNTLLSPSLTCPALPWIHLSQFHYSALSFWTHGTSRLNSLFSKHVYTCCIVSFHVSTRKVGQAKAWRFFGPNLRLRIRWRASLVVQWLRVHLLMQGTRVRALVWEDPTCRRATRPVSHSYWAYASGACAPQQERPR